MTAHGTPVYERLLQGNSAFLSNFQFESNKRINLKMASDRKSMAEAKVGEGYTKRRKDLHHYRQPIQERSRGHGKTGNVRSKKRGH